MHSDAEILAGMHSSGCTQASQAEKSGLRIAVPFKSICIARGVV